MTAVTRQEVQNMLDTTRSRLTDQLAAKQDVQRLTDSARDRIISYMHDFLMQNQQQFVRQLDMRTKAYVIKLSALESHVQSLLEQEIRVTRQLMEQMSQRQQNVVIPGVQQQAAAGRDKQYRFGYDAT